MGGIEVKTFDRPDEKREFEGKGWTDVVHLSGRTVDAGHFAPGWKWSTNVKPIAGTDSCQFAHLLYCLEGQMKVRMDDGTEQVITPGQVASIAPGHDAEVVGDQACVVIDFGERLEDYAKR